MEWLLSPLTWLLVAGLFAAAGWRVRGHVAARGVRWIVAVAATLAVISLLAMTPLVANALASYLERPLAAAPTCRSMPPSIAVVLAGGVDRLPADDGDFSVLNVASRRRMEYAVRWWREHEHARLVISGREFRGDRPPRASLLAGYARALGMPADALLLERRSLNTWQSARSVAELFPPPARIALVTSAMHMPRARAAFRAAGFEVCPLPTDYRVVPVGPPGYLVPRSGALDKTEAALHELFGIAYYRWLDSRFRPRAESQSDRRAALGMLECYPPRRSRASISQLDPVPGQPRQGILSPAGGCGRVCSRRRRGGACPHVVPECVLLNVWLPRHGRHRRPSRFGRQT